MRHRIIPDIVQDGFVHSLSGDATVLDAAQTMSDRDVGAMIVTDTGGRLAGIVTERDIMRRVVAQGLDPATTTLGQIMTRDPDTLSPDDSALDALEIMRLRHYCHLPVVEGDRVVGMVSVRDLYEVMKVELEANIRETEAYVFGDRYGA
jgi:CBS domain-containing protein